MKVDSVESAVIAREPVPISPRVHWIGALDPTLRNFDIILKTANGTSYNAYVVRGSTGVAAAYIFFSWNRDGVLRCPT